MTRPDYSGAGIVNLMASIIVARGGDGSTYPEATLLPARELADIRDLVLIVIDGLGETTLMTARPGGALRTHRRGRLSSVFPSTTATAICTFLTGLAPLQHGVTGWFTHFEEIGGVTTVLPFLNRIDGTSLLQSGVDPAHLLQHTPVFDLVKTPSWTIMPEKIAHSPFNLAHSGQAQIHTFKTLPQLFQSILEVIASDKGAKYIHAYWPRLDHLAHEHGARSQAVATHLAELELAFNQFLGALGPQTGVILTADHGLVDCKPAQQIVVNDHPELAQTLALPLCGEQRVAYCYVHPDRHCQFKEYVSENLSEFAQLHPSLDLVTEGYFGPGAPHPRLFERVGDYTLIMKGPNTIKDWLPNEKRFKHIGVHGGLTDEELYVPLIFATGQA